jgi:Glyoxalase-like domain
VYGPPVPTTPRLRQAVLVASDLEAVAGQLRAELGLGEPFADPGVELFGLRNAVFALGDAFLEVVSPVRDGTSAGRLLERRGGDGGYMVMLQVDQLAACRARARDREVREVFEVELDDIAEVHLHPRDMHGVIVSLSQPAPPASWRWGGPDWSSRSAPLSVTSVRVEVDEAPAASALWSDLVGAPLGEAGVELVPGSAGLVVVGLHAGDGRKSGSVEVGGVRFVVAN